MGHPAPVIASAGDLGVRIRHREYIGDVLSSTPAGSFGVSSFLINPTNSDLFPWLSQLAKNFQEYKMEGLFMEFRTTSADALTGTNTALGTVMMATNYNSAASNFQSKREMENSQFGQSCKPSQSLRHFVECAPARTAISDTKYCRQGVIPASADPRLYDLGKFQIATVGVQAAAVNLGELWVSYQVTLMKPIDAISNLWVDYKESMFVTDGVTASDGFGNLATRTANVGGAVVSTTNTYGWQSNAFGITMPSPTSTTLNITIPANQLDINQVYLMEFEWPENLTGATSLTQFPDLTLVIPTGFTLVNYWSYVAGSKQQDKWGVPATGPCRTALCMRYVGAPTNPVSYNFVGTAPSSVTTFAGVTAGVFLFRFKTALGYNTLNV